jgi:Cu-Zn family superoxide dismutase
MLRARRAATGRMVAMMALASAGVACARAISVRSGGPPDAAASLVDSAGRVVGRVELRRQPPNVRLEVTVGGIPAGTHGIHIHAVGRCDPPTFASAGPHFNPSGRQHGLEASGGPHAGDLPNFVVTPGDTARYEARTTWISLDDGAPNSLFDADSSALVIHAAPDDNATDPSGNSGARIACGVIRRGA